MENDETVAAYGIGTMASSIDDRNRIIKQGECFAVFDRHADIRCEINCEQGLFHQGTRHLSCLALRLNGVRPFLLNSSVVPQNTLLVVDMTNPDIRAGGRIQLRSGSIHLFRAKLLWDATCYEYLRVTNHARGAIDLTLAIELAADYADVFEVRGLKRHRRGEALEPLVEADRMVYGYRGLDGIVRHTAVAFLPAPSSLSREGASFSLRLEPQAEWALSISIRCYKDESPPQIATFEAAVKAGASALARAHGDDCGIESSNGQFNDWLNRSQADLHMLVTETRHGPYPFAGIPWFCTPFGRDGLITAMECLWVNPGIAKGVLSFLSATQAQVLDTRREAEPGKILHESRDGELAALGEIPFGQYYGTVDATPLFIMLAGDYFRRTGDRGFIASIWRNVVAAIQWIDQYGDADRDGFVEYERHNPRGLINQGWKDSDDAVFHADGTLASGHIALCEVQGYVYAAKLAAAELAEELGESALAQTLARQADELKTRFNQVFWCDDLSTFALALDGDKRPCRVRTSNAGHCLFSGIACREYGRRTADTLLDPETSFSGWGIRTVAASEARYNPMSYHNGSVWPHDNAMIAMGFARYGLKAHALRLLTAQFESSLQVDLHRLPELFCGFRRRPDESPTIYPTACSPQAWVSGAPFWLLQACLGLTFRNSAPQLTFVHPVLPDFLDRVAITGLRVGTGFVDILLERHAEHVGINVLRKDPDVEVAMIV
ncbi:MAG: amylo-alpha-1,6-glucosidase [Betaproteobacteria bacterium]|nr:amylo-alpha-1,6-glucosidase [Betaproteobacteria bacterium]